ncbi:P1 family peptidase [Saprospiraceae bacterium]|jgi:D-aminopeptidase|nr:P1 family peptidase [Saprospiraceae bacterium]MDG1435768.1 P1 family peptidase [Saprospiraceae bacterium]
MKTILLLFFSFFICFYITAQKKQLRDFGIEVGVLPIGENNTITDVKNVQVGHFTLIKGDSVRTGVTAILPHNEDIFQKKVPAAIYIANGFGKLMGISQVEELGNIETPIILTNTLSVPTAADALIDYTIFIKKNNIRSVNPLVGETNDARLNDIQGRHLQRTHILKAIKNASSKKVEEGNIGAGTGTVCFGFKGGIGSSSRKLPGNLGGYTVGVLVQTNFGGVLQIDGIPIGKELNKYYLQDQLNESPDGSCMIVVATDAPLDTRNLKRLAKRAFLGLGKTGGIASNGSGDYVIAFSTAEDLRVSYQSNSKFEHQKVLRNDGMSPLFMAVNEATEEAILNSLFAAETMVSKIKGKEIKIEALPIKEVLEILKKYNRIDESKKE